MRFVLRMAGREIRAAWRRLVFFFLCLAIGVASIVTLRSVIQAVRETLTKEARTILGADLTVSTNRPWDTKVRSAIDGRLAAVRATQRLEEIETLSMVRPADAAKATARLVELRGVQAGYPMYGTLAVEGGQRYAHELLRNQGVLVRPELLAQLDVSVGDQVVIGALPFTVRGVIASEPGRRAGAFSFGSRVFMDLADLQRTGLITYGSRASYRVLLRVPDQQVDTLARDLRTGFTGQFVSVRSHRSTEDNINRDLERTENYLSLVGLVIVVLGGVGVWSVVRVFVQQKLKSVAILKCVGASTRQVLAIYVAQVLTMGLAGSASGVAIAWGVLAWVKPIVDRMAGIETASLLSASAAAQGVAVGLLVSLLFALVPLLEVRFVRPSMLLRASEAPRVRRDWTTYAVIGAVGAALVGIAAWQAASLKVGAILSIGFAAVVLVLQGAAWLLVKAIAPLQASPRFAVRYAARRVARPGNQTRAILMAVGLGAFLVVGVRALQANLLREFQLELRPDTPDMFLIDVQPDQAAPMRAFLARPEAGLRGSPLFIPVLRARVTGVKGASQNLDRYEDVRERGHGLGREYVITYRDALQRNERVIEGRFWPPTPSTVAEVSIERGLRDRSGLQVGDMVRFDVLGRSVEARVTSIRSVDWADASAGGFMFVFRPGVLDAAPGTFVVPLRGPGEAGDRARLQRDLTAAFPNVSAVDVKEVLAGVAVVIGNVTLGVTVVGSLVLFSGILILVGSISMTKFQRTYEAAILKTLGATTPLVATLLAVEYGLLGLVAGIIGSAGAMGLSWGVSRYALDVPWHPQPLLIAAGVLSSVSLVAIVGFLASLDVLRRKPLGTLRAE
jgi:putative ABC transport system permease protein